MKYLDDPLTIKGVTLGAALIAFLTLMTSPLMAQRDPTAPRAPTPMERMEMRRARQGAIMEDEMRLRGLMKDKDKDVSNDQAHLRLIIEQARRDFERLQLINDDIMRAVTANTGFNYKSLTEMTGEIRKRAKRLKENTNLPPPAPAPENQKKLDQISREEMRSALMTLNERIISFATNPLFQTPNWIDLNLGAQASRDLETIIELSGVIKKNADRLSKPSK